MELSTLLSSFGRGEFFMTKHRESECSRVFCNSSEILT